MTVDAITVEAALAGLRRGLQADGYDLVVETVSEGVARVRVTAGPNACEECLVPKPITVGALKASLRALPEITGIDLVYPTDS
jgi:hypothetical protein